MTTISVPLKQIANTAVDILIHRIEMQAAENHSSVFSPQNIKLAPQLIIRDSTGQAPG